MKAGVLPLAIETGRYRNMDEELRVCHVCEKGCVEDEEHIITVCEKFETEQTNLKAEFGSIRDLSNLSGTDLMREMLHPDCVKVTAKHISTMLDKRKDILYENIERQNLAEALLEMLHPTDEVRPPRHD